jgi:hypothetical protein
LELIDTIARTILKFFQDAWQPAELSSQITLIALAGCGLCFALYWFIGRRIKRFGRQIERGSESGRASLGDQARLSGLVLLRLLSLAGVVAIVVFRPPVFIWLIPIGLIYWMLRQR